jgi:release factor glutamine methyltransferase
VAADDPHLGMGDLRFEPKQALTSSTDGLGLLRAIISQAPGQLFAGGWLLLEHGYDQGESVSALLAAAGLVDVFTERDLAGLPRVSGARVLSPHSPTLSPGGQWPWRKAAQRPG